MELEKISKCFYINLDRREDRKKHIQKTLPFYAERASAFDAQTENLTPEIKKIFGDSLNILSKGAVACFMSHYRLWKKLSMDNDAKNYLILEDDVVFEKGFSSFWNNAFSKNIPKEYFLIYLGGCQPWNKKQYHNVTQPHNPCFNNIKSNTLFSKKPSFFWHMTTCSYIMSKQAAIMACQYIEQFGADKAVDFFLLKFFEKNKMFSAPHLIFHLSPLMSHQLHEEGDNFEIDKKSDIQNDGEKFEDINIPKIIHQTWKDDAPKKNLSKIWKNKNPSHTYFFYTDNDIADIIEKNFSEKIFKCYSRLIAGAAKADFFRYCILYLKGGIYCDIDFLPIEPFSSFIKKEHEIIVCTDQYGLFNAFIATKPNNPFFLELIEKICNNIEQGLHRKGAFAIMKLSACTILKDHFCEFFSKNKSKPNSRLILKHNTETSGEDYIELDQKKIITCQNLLECQERQASNGEHYTKVPELYSLGLTKIIHHSWKTKDIPYSLYRKKWIDSWKNKNPEWEYNLWTDKDNRNLIKEHYPKYLKLYDSYKRSIQRADMSRLFYMHKFGGLYTDLDFICLKPMEEILDPSKINLGIQEGPENYLPNALMYSPPGEGFWMDCAEKLKDYMHDSKGKYNQTEHSTGPCFLYNCYKQIKPNNCVIHEPKVFYPISWANDGSAANNTVSEDVMENPSKHFPDSFAVTFWSSGWIDRSSKKPNNKKTNVIWQSMGGKNNCYERDWIMEILSGIEANHIDDENREFAAENSIVIYSDMFSSDINRYPESMHEKWKQNQLQQKKYFDKFKNFKNCILFHLSDEHTQAETSHYKYFKHIFRNYYRKDVDQENVTFIPLGYKKDFNNE